MTYDPTKNPAQHREISRLGGKASGAAHSRLHMAQLAVKGGKATAGISKNRGASNGSAKLTPQQVRYARASGKSAEELAAELPSTRQNFARILAGETWGWLK